MKRMPALGAKCVEDFNNTLSIAAATETLWLTAPPTSEVRKHLKVPQLEALYEAAFLRIFSAYENFLEDSLSHFMAKYETATYTPVAATGKTLHSSLKAALIELYDGRPYILWHGVSSVIKRSRKHLDSSPIETALIANQAMLEDYARIRHRIAHGSPDAATEFLNAATRLTGNTHGGKPGRLLRAADITDPLNQPKWIRNVVDGMADVVLQICP
ncbi:hypothetical protein [Nocardioides luteus]|uniref:hypothetical protein n=1 Tax=Nocardioides luteus TaxID=1844 RepID=UPI0018C91062|nr:hypothetical protein [Nocardioides luteus]MBG6098327.1 hypothetical protein [Nocardioides luteus]